MSEGDRESGTANDDFFEVVETTRSVRRRLDFDRPVPKELIERCIDAAVQAPTGLNRESWRFVILTDPEPKEKIATLYRASFEALKKIADERLGDSAPGAVGKETWPSERPTYVGLAENLHRMPALILVCSEGRPQSADLAMQVSFFGSVLPAAWSLMLALRASGLGTTWTTLLTMEEARVSEVLGIPAGVTQTVLLPVAYTKGAVLRRAQRKSAQEVTFWNRWGQKD